MHKIWLIIKREYLVRVRKKSFIIMTILGPLLMVSLLVLPVYLASEGQEERIIAISEEEKEFIGSRFDSKLLKKIYKEINSDNDYQRIQKVMVYTYQNNYLSQDLDILLKEIKELLICDGRFDNTEQALYYYDFVSLVVEHALFYYYFVSAING